ncbi:hypothetical protein H4R33_004988 [Dimargaris cristalligena]|nr:hypothetical protein H4R33_004988 [Dimargaris cristalligena]
MSSKFWNTVKKYLVVNPNAAESMFNPGTYRKPSPDSQKKYVPKVTKAFAVSDNYYWQRDVRRNYPRLALYSQTDVAQMIAAPAAETIAAPAQDTDAAATAAAADVTATSASAELTPTANLTAVIQALDKPLFSETHLPPLPGKGYKYTISEELQEHEPGVYFPIYNVY